MVCCIENFINQADNDSNYQINRAKAAIKSGSIFGLDWKEFNEVFYHKALLILSFL